jgi:starvation-inducible DNA-binding protein
VTEIAHPLEDTRRTATAAVLQQTLVDLLDLGLLAKQAHWNTIGPDFRSIHEQLDELACLARDSADTVAERTMTLGVNPDGRAATVSRQSRLSALPPGYLADCRAVELIVDILLTVVDGLRNAVAETESTDPVSQDLLIGITAAVERQYWMFQAQC